MSYLLIVNIINIVAMGTNRRYSRHTSRTSLHHGFYCLLDEIINGRNERRRKEGRDSVRGYMFIAKIRKTKLTIQKKVAYPQKWHTRYV